jgi:hypothetical protein
VLIVAVTGCARLARPTVVVVPPPQPIAPFDENPVSFIVGGPRFSPGEVTIVKVCIGADRTIVSADVIESSGDRRFDDMAVMWARQVKVRTASEAGSVLARCGEVRVEIRKPSDPTLGSGPDSSLG